MSLKEPTPTQLLSVRDLAGPVELTIEIVCRSCRRRTTLIFSPNEALDYCGHCDEPYEYRFDYHRLFGAPEVL